MSQDHHDDPSRPTLLDPPGQYSMKGKSLFPVKAMEGDEEQAGGRGLEGNEIVGTDEGLTLEEDTYTLLLVTGTYGKAFCVAVLIFIMQVSLLASILAQMLSKTGPNSRETFFNIPFATTESVQFGQFVAIVFGLLTQRDLLGTVPLFIALWKIEDNWSELNKTADGKKKLRSNERLFWWEKIFVTYALRLSVSLLTLFTAFILIVQSTDIIDLVKDFTALFIVSELDEYAFMAIQDGYLGQVFKKEIKRAKRIRINTEESHVSCCNKNVPTQSIVMLVLFSAMFGTWAGFLLKQRNGFYFKQVYGNCNVIEHDKSISYLSWGDGKCDPKLFTEDCGNDGGDCDDQCTTFFQFSVDDPFQYIDYTSVLSQGVDDGLTYDLVANATLKWYYPYIDELYETFNDEYSECEIKGYRDAIACENIASECKAALNSGSLKDSLRECFSDDTLYHSDHEWFCWFGYDAITNPTDSRGTRKSKIMKHLMRGSIKNSGWEY